MWLLVGLGNPGPQYALDRHNVGFMALDLLREQRGPCKETFSLGGSAAHLKLETIQLLTLKPLEFMNLSGRAVGAVARFYKIPPTEILVIHDELDLPFGQVQVKQGGGHGGHNGLRSIIANMGADFVRIRVGVGRPGFGVREQVANYLLSPFDKTQQKELPFVLSRAADCAMAVVNQGLPFAMNQYNRKI